MSSALFFGSLGTGLACYSNVIRKLPAFRRPWEHVAYFAIGAYIGSRVPEFKATQKRELEKTQAARDTRLEERAKRIAAKQTAAAQE